jgi:hypothetical protein
MESHESALALDALCFLCIRLINRGAIYDVAQKGLARAPLLRLVLVHSAHLHHAGVALAGELRQLGLHLGQLVVQVVDHLRTVHGLDCEGLAGGPGRSSSPSSALRLCFLDFAV